MRESTLPPNWRVIGPVPSDFIDERPSQPKDKERLRLHGMISSDGYQIYEMPVATRASEVVRFFRVGSHNSGRSPNERIERVAALADKIMNLVPARPIFADEASLTLKFLREVTEADLQHIEALFPEEEMFELGLESYVAMWDGESSWLSPVLESGQFDFW